MCLKLRVVGSSLNKPNRSAPQEVSRTGATLIFWTAHRPRTLAIFAAVLTLVCLASCSSVRYEAHPPRFLTAAPVQTTYVYEHEGQAFGWRVERTTVTHLAGTHYIFTQIECCFALRDVLEQRAIVQRHYVELYETFDYDPVSQYEWFSHADQVRTVTTSWRADHTAVTKTSGGEEVIHPAGETPVPAIPFHGLAKRLGLADMNTDSDSDEFLDLGNVCQVLSDGSSVKGRKYRLNEAGLEIIVGEKGDLLLCDFSNDVSVRKTKAIPDLSVEGFGIKNFISADTRVEPDRLC